MRGAFTGTEKVPAVTIESAQYTSGRRLTRPEFLSRRKQSLQQDIKKIRPRCLNCRQPVFTCYCSHIKSFSTQIRFIILIHPLENDRRIATGRMAHLCLKNSELILGCDYSDDVRVNEIILNPANSCSVLFPGIDALDIGIHKNAAALTNPACASPVVFVIDGTWRTARKTLHLSRNLARLLKICFTPQKPSNFRVRKQPKEGFVSSIEAIHRVIELTDSAEPPGAQERLLNVFDKMVEQQLEIMKQMRL